MATSTVSSETKVCIAGDTHAPDGNDGSPVPQVGGAAAVIGGFLWIAFGVFEFVQPLGIDRVYDDDRAYDVVVDQTLFSLYSAPGAVALMLTSCALLAALRTLGSARRRSARTASACGAAAVTAALVSLVGVATSGRGVGMSVEKRPNGRWRGRYRDRSGVEHSKHFTRKADAITWEREQRRAIARGEWLDPALSSETVGDFAPTWLATKAGLRETTRANYEMLLRVHVLPRWEKVSLTAVTVSSVVAWEAAMVDAGRSASGRRQAVQALSQILDLAVRDSRLLRNPARGIKVSATMRRQHRYLTHDQLLHLAVVCGSAHPQHESLIFVAGLTGLRWGELRALQVRHLNLLRMRLVVEANLPSGSRSMTPVLPKSHQRREVALPSSLREPLARLIEGRSRVDFLFATPQGTPLDLSNWRRTVFAPAVTRCGLEPLTPHDLRHTAASLAIQAGANVKVVQRMLGRASAAMTLDVYAGLFDSDLESVASLLDAGVRDARSAHQSH